MFSDAIDARRGAQPELSLHRRRSGTRCGARSSRARVTAGVYASIQRDQPNLFSASPVFLARAQLDHMRAVIGAIESVVRSEPFRRWALDLARRRSRASIPARAASSSATISTSGPDGPQLIEINTNAGGGLLNAALARAQRACCAEVRSGARRLARRRRPGGAFPRHVPRRVAAAAGRGGARQHRHRRRSIRAAVPLPRVPHVPRAVRARRAAPRPSPTCAISVCASGALRAAGGRIDLVYNRLTDFYLAGRDVRGAARGLRRRRGGADAQSATLCPLRRQAASDRAVGSASGCAPGASAPRCVELLAASVPRRCCSSRSHARSSGATASTTSSSRSSGYGGKAAYRGDKLTRAMWERLLEPALRGPAPGAAEPAHHPHRRARRCRSSSTCATTSTTARCSSSPRACTRGRRQTSAPPAAASPRCSPSRAAERARRPACRRVAARSRADGCRASRRQRMAEIASVAQRIPTLTAPPSPRTIDAL